MVEMSLSDWFCALIIVTVIALMFSFILGEVFDALFGDDDDDDDDWPMGDKLAVN